MTHDPTENIRRAATALNNSNAGAREELEARHGRAWDTHELQQEFKVLGFMAPYIVVQRRSDGAKGSLEFQHDPRFYFNWREYR